MNGISVPARALRFQCTGCGGCCTGRGEHYIAVTRKEQRRIRDFLGISWRWFRRRYVTVDDDGLESLRWADNRCVFLEDKRCRVYAVRPAQCRQYPFWPELVESKRAWQKEARRCEGIGRGPVIPLYEVKARLHVAPDES